MANYSAFEVQPGQRWGNWTVLTLLDERDSGGNIVCAVRCECGKEATVKAHRLANGVSTQCRSCAQKGRREAEANVVNFPPVHRGPSRSEIERTHAQEVQYTTWQIGSAVASYVRARDVEERESIETRIDELREKLRALGEDDHAVVMSALEQMEKQLERRNQRLQMR